ncbi:MAG: hypothetical protein JSU60_02740, partial [Nitrospirota bacterium]
ARRFHAAGWAILKYRYVLDVQSEQSEYADTSNLGMLIHANDATKGSNTCQWRSLAIHAMPCLRFFWKIVFLRVLYLKGYR